MQIKASFHWSDVPWTLDTEPKSGSGLPPQAILIPNSVGTHKGQDGVESTVPIFWGQKSMHIWPQPKCLALIITLSLVQNRTQFTTLSLLTSGPKTHKLYYTYMINAAHGGRKKRNKQNAQPHIWVNTVTWSPKVIQSNYRPLRKRVSMRIIRI